jgi:hypothetical protein
MGRMRMPLAMPTMGRMPLPTTFLLHVRHARGAAMLLDRLLHVWHARDAAMLLDR